MEESFNHADVIIDFTAPVATEQYTKQAVSNKKPLVIGTTGLTSQQEKIIFEASRVIPILYSPNMSVGVNLLFKLIELGSKTFGQEYAIEISETHHIHKKDKPSGTAKKMAEIVEKTRGIKPPIESNREGEVVGEHTIIFGSEHEHLAILHEALDRKVFAQGALLAAKWILGKSPGLYTMADVLGL